MVKKLVGYPKQYGLAKVLLVIGRIIYAELVLGAFSALTRTGWIE